MSGSPVTVGYPHPVPTKRSAPTLTLRALNRATLVRQILLGREQRDVAETLEYLVGMQAQLPNAPYVALWSRLEGFRPADLSQLVADRRALRMSLMRGTIHLVTAGDALVLRPAVQPALERDVYGNSTFGRHRLEGLDMDAVLAAGRELVEEQPLTNVQIRDALAGRWPDRDPAALGYAVRGLLPMVHVTPRGIWQQSGPIALTTVEAWLGRSVDPVADLDTMVLRYLAAYGPSSVVDAQTWSRLTGLREVFERLRPRLAVFELFDLPDAPRPEPDIPAPPRFLPEYDNVLLAHADRTRFVDDDVRKRIQGEGLAVGSILLDGVAGGTWTTGESDGVTTLTIRALEPMGDDARASLVDEATLLLAFLAPDAAARRVTFGRPA
jgi:hypothetical protein